MHFKKLCQGSQIETTWGFCTESNCTNCRIFCSVQGIVLLPHTTSYIHQFQYVWTFKAKGIIQGKRKAPITGTRKNGTPGFLVWSCLSSSLSAPLGTHLGSLLVLFPGQHQPPPPPPPHTYTMATWPGLTPPSHRRCQCQPFEGKPKGWHSLKTSRGEISASYLALGGREYWHFAC